MKKKTVLRACARMTLFFFACFCLASGFGRGADEDPLAEAKKLIKAGSYEEAARLLSGYIDKIRDIAKQKSRVAEAHYLLARMYYEVGEDQKCEVNLRAAFQYDAELGKDEVNPGLRALMEKIRAEVAPQVAEKLKKEEERLALKRARPKKKFPWLLAAGAVVVVVVAVVLLTKKKYYTLTVTTSAGVDGTPPAGTYSHLKGTELTYQYSVSDGYMNFMVKINGTATPETGTLVMDRDIRVEVSATQMAMAATMDVYARENCIELSGSPAAKLSLPAGTYNVHVLGTAYYSAAHAYSNYSSIFVLFPASGGSGVPGTAVLPLGGPLQLSCIGGDFLAFFADWQNLEDNSGEFAIDFGSHIMFVSAKNNCIRIDTSKATSRDISPGTYQVRVTGNPTYGGTAPFTRMLVHFTGGDGKAQSASLEIGRATTLTIGSGVFYAFFVDYGGVDDNAGKATLEFFKY